jgi:hypothetical protein
MHPYEQIAMMPASRWVGHAGSETYMYTLGPDPPKHQSLAGLDRPSQRATSRYERQGKAHTREDKHPVMLKIAIGSSGNQPPQAVQILHAWSDNLHAKRQVQPLTTMNQLKYDTKLGQTPSFRAANTTQRFARREKQQKLQGAWGLTFGPRNVQKHVPQPHGRNFFADQITFQRVLCKTKARARATAPN